MDTYWAYLACVGTSLCYGMATVLEQIGVKNTLDVKKISASVVGKLLRQVHYLQGLLLDLFGWLMVLYAVRILPLFLVQSFMASSLTVSAIFDHYWQKSEITHFEKISIVVVLTGLVLLALVARPGENKTINNLFIWVIILALIVILFISTLMLRMKHSKSNSILLALIAGISFGGTSIASRIISAEHFRLMSVSSLLVAAIVCYGFLAMFLLSVALQRGKINRINSALFPSEVIIPSLLGMIFLGDHVAHGQTWGVILGLILIIAGTFALSIDTKHKVITPNLIERTS